MALWAPFVQGRFSTALLVISVIATPFHVTEMPVGCVVSRPPLLKYIPTIRRVAEAPTVIGVPDPDVTLPVATMVEPMASKATAICSVPYDTRPPSEMTRHHSRG